LVSFAGRHRSNAVALHNGKDQLGRCPCAGLAAARSILVSVCAFLLFALLTLLYRKNTRWLLLSFSTAAGGWIVQQFFQIPFPLDFIASYALYFLAGSLWMQWQQEDRLRNLPALTGIALLSGSILLSAVFHVQWGFTFQSRSLWLLPIALSAIAGICLLCRQWSGSARPYCRRPAR
jgi:hypothetical protein